MRYIKTYEETKAVNNITGDIVIYLEDIFMELEDSGFTIQVTSGFNTSVVADQTAITVSIVSPTPSKYRKFLYSEIKDSVESSIDYMDSIGFIPININVEKVIMGKNKIVRWYRGDAYETLPDQNDKLIWCILYFNVPF
jgi:hypothetical protein